MVGYLALAIDDLGNIHIIGIDTHKEDLEWFIKTKTKHTNYKIFSIDDNMTVLVALWFEMNGMCKHEAKFLIVKIGNMIYETCNQS